MCNFEGGPARNRVVFINSRRERGKKEPLPESRGTDDLALYLRSLAASKCERREAPSEGPSVDENHPISGRSPPLFRHGSSQTRGKRLRGRAGTSEPSSPTWAIEMHVRVGPGGQSGSRVCAPGASRASDADSARAKSCTRVLCQYSPRLGRRLSE